jgi:hypothetical protein
LSSDPGQSTPQPDGKNPAVYPASTDEKTAPLPAAADGGTTRTLSWLLTTAPFTSLHQRAGEPDKHRWRGWICFVTDYLLRLAVVVLLLAIVAAVAWKTLVPLPNLRPDPAG